MLDALFKPHMDRLWAPLGHLAARLGLTPNVVTLASLVLCALNAAAYTVHQHGLLFGICLLLFEALDNVDGALARATNQCTAFGSYLDAVTDRYKDALAVLAVAIVHGLWLPCSALLTGSLLVSYTQARAQAQGVQKDLVCVLPMFERLERVVGLATGLMVAQQCTPLRGVWVLQLVLWGSAALTHMTALQRIFGAWQALGAGPAHAAAGPAALLPTVLAKAIATATAKTAGHPSLAASATAARRCYAQSKGDTEWRGDWPAYVLFRPLSFHITPWAVSLGLTATGITCGCGAIASWLLPIAWMLPVAQAALVVGGLGALFQLLDCLDGNVARVRGSVSKGGDYLSMLVGQWYWVMLWSAFGALAGRASSGVLQNWGLVCGVVLGLVVVLGRLCREYVASQKPPAAAQAAAAVPHRPLRPWLAQARLFGSGLDNLIFAVVPIASAARILPEAFVATCIYGIGVFMVTQYECWQAVRA